MHEAAIAIFCIFFATYAFFRYTNAIALFFALLPTYMIRLTIGPLPTTLLELMFGILVFIWLFQEGPRIVYHLAHIARENRLLVIGIGLFLLGATISIFTSVSIRAALGEWKAFYIQPVIFFILLITSIKTREEFTNILFGLVLSGVATSLLAIYQHFTGWMVPWAFWENGASYRVTAWYGFPNGVGLFLAPLVPLAAYLLTEYKDSGRDSRLHTILFRAVPILLLLTAPFAILFAKSTGAIVGLAAGVGFLFWYNKKTRTPAIVLGAIGLLLLLFVPALKPIRTEVFFADRSGQIRLGIWKETVQLLQDRPVWGAGMASYDKRILPYHKQVNGENIEIFHHPHNILLILWVNTGLLGLAGFVCIVVWFYMKNRERFLLCAMTVLLVHGLVDAPYIKNDLSMLFWLLPALLIIKDLSYENMEI